MKQIQFPKMSMIGRSGKDKTSAVSNLATSLVSQRKPDGLIASTSNLYFTSHDGSTTSIWRTAQTAHPGQESLLYSETAARFGDIVFAKIVRRFALLELFPLKAVNRHWR